MRRIMDKEIENQFKEFNTFMKLEIRPKLLEIEHWGERLAKVGEMGFDAQ